MEPPINPTSGAPIATARHHRQDRRLTVEVIGEIDRATAPYVAAYVDDVVAEGDAVVALAVGEVTFCDSSGVRMILNLARAADEAGRTFRLAKPSGEVLRTIEVCGASEVLAIDD